MRPKKIIVTFDVGTSKICAVIAGYFGEREGWKTLGTGFAPSAGIKKGRLIQPTAVQKGMEHALAQARGTGQLSPSEAVIALPSSVCKTLWHEETRAFYAERSVNDNDIKELTERFPRLPKDSKNRLLKAVIHQYRCDKGPWTPSLPTGLRARAVSAAGQIFYLDEADAVQWTSTLNALPFAKIHFGIASEALAAHIQKEHASLTDWLQFDLGAGLTQAALIERSHVVRQGATIVAGNHILHDLMYGVNIDLPEARRLLHEQGHADGKASEEDIVHILREDGSEKTAVSRAYVYRIINARVRELFAFLQDEISHWTKEGFTLPDTIVLEGGLSLLPGIDSVVQKLFNKKVHLLHATKNIAAHTAAGLLTAERPVLTPKRSRIERFVMAVGRWFKEFA